MWRENAGIGNLRVNSLTIGGVPTFGGGVPQFGDTYFVDGTYGSDGAGGLSAKKPLKTIQAAITQQIARTKGRGDVIYIAPGTYSEYLTGDLTGVSLVGVHPRMVTVSPGTTYNAYAGNVTNSLIKGITFDEPTAAADYACVAIPKLVGSTISDCVFMGKSGDAGSTGLRIGAETSAASDYMLYSIVTRNMFAHSGGRTKEFGYGIHFGEYNVGTDSDTRLFAFSEISHNQIFAEEAGIYMQVDAANGGGLIYRNFIGSRQNNGNTSTNGIYSGGDSTDLLTNVVENYVCSVTNASAIAGFTAGNVFGNYISGDGGTPIRENPAGA